MKTLRHRFLATFVLSAAAVTAQTTLYVPSGPLGTSSNGNVGVGTSSPVFKLDVLNNNYNAIRATGNSSNSVGVYVQNTVASGRQWALLSSGGTPAPAGNFVIWDDTAGVPRLSINSSGYVGIGTNSPADKLVVQGGHADTRLRLFSDNYGEGMDGPHTALLSLWASEPSWSWTGVGIGNNVANTGGIVRVTNTRGGSYLRLLDNQVLINNIDGQGNDRAALVMTNGNVGIGTATLNARLTVDGGHVELRSGNVFMLRPTGNAWDYRLQAVGTRFDIVSGGDLTNPKMTIEANGNVGIGTTSPTHKLSVNGTIRAKEVIVDTGWSDYVFADNYRLAPLSEVEVHIKAEGHLPGIPSAQEVAEHGVSMGEMQSKLLAKIEELTLHLIAQEKERQVQTRDVAALRAENGELRERLRQVENNLHPLK